MAVKAYKAPDMVTFCVKTQSIFEANALPTGEDELLRAKAGPDLPQNTHFSQFWHFSPPCDATHTHPMASFAIPLMIFNEFLMVGENF